MNIRKSKPVIGISIGDINGVGAEVTIKALQDSRLHKIITPVIYGHGKVLTFYKKALGLEDFNFMQIRNISEVHHKKINVINVLQDSPEIIPGVETAEAGKMALAALSQAVADLKDNHLNALVTAPLNKNNIHTPENNFIGHTEYLTEAFESKKSMMFMVSEDMRVGLVTAHVPLRAVADLITPQLIREKLNIMIQSLKDDFGISKPKIAVLGLNAHAGEDGLLGKEEIEIIQPLIRDYKDKGVLVFGPYPADGFFGMLHHRKFDGILAMYHDQGLIPFKTISFETGVNFTAGLPVVRTSPDHGTAYDIAGKNMANEGSMRAALFQAYEIICRKGNWEEE